MYAPKCPNHHVPLVDCHKGIGICPVSTARFSYSADEAAKTKKLKVDMWGKTYADANWKITHIDGDDI